MIDIVDNAPTVNEWIPVTERMPEEEGIYLVTTDCGLGQSTFQNGTWGATRMNVVAWLPLPEPYKECK
ncbi:MAG: DUF551 domain-containing protein [Lachnospiraceae bacterium]|nr:DUF551 domain-containing protein [Lachnospiraceae bacterium]